VAAFKALIRYFSYLFHGLLALFLLAISGLALTTGGHTLHLGMLPWTGSTLTYVVFFGSLFGLVSVILAIRGTLPVLFFLWSLAVLVLMVKGYVLTGYRFSSGEARTAGYLMLCSVIALLGAWWSMWVKSKRRPRY
jgi:hypothetical protein